MRRYNIFLFFLYVFITMTLFAGGISEGSTYAKTILERNDEVSEYFKQVVEPYTLKNGPLQLTAVPLLSESYLLSQYPDMEKKRYSFSKMVNQVKPTIKELDSQQEMGGTFFVYLRYEQNEEILNASSFSIDPSFFDYMFLDNDRGEFLRVSEFSVQREHRISVSNPVFGFLVKFGKNATEREDFFSNAKEISISVTDFGFEGESIQFQIPLSQLFSEMPEEINEIIKPIRSRLIVKFNGANTSTLYYQSYGETIKEPETPEKSGYTFKGWYKDSNYVEKWNFETDILTGNTMLYAKWQEEIAFEKIAFRDGLYYNLIDILFLFDKQKSMHSMPVLGAGYLAGINYKEHGITLGAGIGLNLMMATDILLPPSAETAYNHYADLSLFLPVLSFDPGLFNLSIITDISLYDFTWSSKFAAKLNLSWVSFSLGVGYFSEAEKFLPYIGFGVLNSLTL